MLSRLRHPLVALAAVIALTIPWLVLRGLGFVPMLPVSAVILVSGVAVIGAAFVLTWGAEPAEVDVPRSFALAVLAIIAVAPDMPLTRFTRGRRGRSQDATGRRGGQPRRRKPDLPTLTATVEVPPELVDDARELYRYYHADPGSPPNQSFEEYLQDVVMDRLEIEFRYPADRDLS